MPRCSAIDRAAAVTVVLRYVRCHILFQQSCHEATRVVAPVTARRDLLRGWFVRVHRQRRVSPGCAGGLCEPHIRDQSIPVLRQHMAQVCQLRFDPRLFLYRRAIESVREACACFTIREKNSPATAPSSNRSRFFVDTVGCHTGSFSDQPTNHRNSRL
jgi:hypothetical protein